jgi:hypothetical protein
MKHIIPLGGAPVVNMPLQGRCIYCGKKPPQALLTREHIIPDGIGGNLVLPDGSCRECADSFKSFESSVINTSFGMARASLGVRAKKRRGKKRQPKTHYTTYDYEGRRGTEALHPITPQMPSIIVTASNNSRARILTGDTSPAPDIAVHIASLKHQEIPDQRTIAASIHPGEVSRFVAKIAHCYSVAAFGVGEFRPYLLEFIQSAGSKIAYTNAHLIGSAPRTPNANILHEISVTVVERTCSQLPLMPASTKQLAVVTVKLFCPYGIPDYEIVAGEIPGV